MALEFNRRFEPRTGEAVAVAPGVRRVTAPNAGPFTFHGTNTFLIGRNSLAVLDPGPADPGHIDALVRAIEGARVSHILVSHTHRDHSPGARLLQARTGGTIIAEGLHRPARPRPGDEALQLETGADVEFAPDTVISDGDMLEVPGYRLQALATPGHTANHLAFALLGTGILFSGDHVMGWSTTVVAPPDGAMADYMASLDPLLERPEQTYFPAHGGAIGDAHSYVRALRAHRRMREAAILEGLRRGDRTIADLVGRVYQGLDPRLTGAAALSTLAHLEDLVARGLACAEKPATLNGRYRAAASAGSG